MAFQVLSRLPGGQPLYHALQRGVTGSSRQTEGRLLGKIEQTLTYGKWLETNTPADWLKNASHLDLGAGWLPSVPMTFYALGTPRQYLVDITPHLEPQAVIETIKQFRAVAPRAERKFARIPELPPAGEPLNAMLERLGMTYAAPYDELARRIDSTVNFATATHMLLHLDQKTLLSVFRTVHRFLAPGGYFLAQLHLRQLFDGLNSRTSPFFSLRYSEAFWERVVNSPMMSYNRFKARDYRATLETAGFEIAHFDVEPGRPEDLELLKRARIHPMFAHYSAEELAARHLFFVARKPC
jgi:hypothetical protein